MLLSQHVFNFREGPNQDYAKAAKCSVQYLARIRLLQKIHDDQHRTQTAAGLSGCHVTCVCVHPLCPNGVYVLNTCACIPCWCVYERAGGGSQGFIAYDARADTIEPLRQARHDALHKHPGPEAPFQKGDNAQRHLGNPSVSTADVPPENAPSSKPTSPAMPIPNVAAMQVPLAEMAASDPPTEAPVVSPKGSVMDSTVAEGNTNATDSLSAVGKDKAPNEPSTDGSGPTDGSGSATARAVSHCQRLVRTESILTTKFPQSAPENGDAAPATECQPTPAMPQTRGAASKARQVEYATVLSDAAAGIQVSFATKEAAEILSKLHEKASERWCYIKAPPSTVRPG